MSYLSRIRKKITLRPFHADGAFAFPVAEMRSDLPRLAARGAGVTLFASGATLAIQLAATVVLARLLTPQDFGVVAMVTTFSLLLVNFGFNGLTEAIVQRSEISHALGSALFWLNLGCGILLTIGFASAGSLLAHFFHDPVVKRVAEGMSLTILITSLSTVHLALLKRAMRFTFVSGNDIVARAVSVVVSILLGWMGWGYWALVAGAVALSLSTTIGAALLCSWRPGLPRHVSGTRETLGFALNTYGNFCVNYLSRNTDNLLVGWRFNAQSLGFYKKAYDLFSLSSNQFISSIAVVVLAGLSRIRNDMALYRRHLLDALSITAFVGMGAGAILTLIGRDLILVLLGPKWGPAGQIFTFFGPGIGMTILYATHGWIHLSAGRPDRWFRWSIFEFAVTVLLFIAGLHWGPAGVATSWSVSLCILTFPAIWYAGKPVGLSPGATASVIWRYVVASFVAVTVAVLIMMHIPLLAGTPTTAQAALRIVIITSLIAPLYLSFVVLLHGSLAPIKQVRGLLRKMLQKPIDRSETPATAEELEVDSIRSARANADRIPLVSILIPAYNAETWIADTLRSALAQTWPRTEIIVVDDGSKDATLSIALQFASEKIRVIAQKNEGASAARNNAFRHCHGDYIQWLDADDLLAPDKIERQMELVLQGMSSRLLLSSPWAHFMYRPWKAKFEPSPLWCDLTPREWLLRKMKHNVFMQTSTWLVSRQLTELAGPWDVRMLGDDDGEYFCRVLMASEGVRFIPDAKVYYRAFRFNSLSYVGRFPEKIEAHWISMKLHIKYLRSMGDNHESRAACLQFLRDSLIYFYPEQRHILQQANELAEELGSSLGIPQLSWKYTWIEVVFGWMLVKPVQTSLRKARWRFAKSLDSQLFRIQRKQVDLFFQGAGGIHASSNKIGLNESRIVSERGAVG